MSYELVKELKDAGWKQEVGRYECYQKDEITGDVSISPTLFELIEACTDDLFEFALRKRVFTNHTDWMAHKNTPAEPKGIGSTPEEAVARLWLALNKKS